MSEKIEEVSEKQVVTFPLFFLAKKPDYRSTEILGITDGPFSSAQEAEDKGRSKYGWDITKYAIVETEQTYKVTQMRISN